MLMLFSILLNKHGFASIMYVHVVTMYSTSRYSYIALLIVCYLDPEYATQTDS